MISNKENDRKKDRKKGETNEEQGGKEWQNRVVERAGLGEATSEAETCHCHTLLWDVDKFPFLSDVQWAHL